MDFNKTLEEWAKTIYENKILQRLNEGEKFAAINIDLGLPPNSDALRKALKRLDIKKDKMTGFYYFSDCDYQKMGIKIMASADVEETALNIARKRYYKYHMDGDILDSDEFMESPIAKEIYEEYHQIASEIGCRDAEDLIQTVLLEWIDKNRPVNRIRAHAIRYMNEHFKKEEIEFILEKEKEGYDLDSLVTWNTDVNVMEFTKEELDSCCKDMTTKE